MLRFFIPPVTNALRLNGSNRREASAVAPEHRSGEPVGFETSKEPERVPSDRNPGPDDAIPPARNHDCPDDHDFERTLVCE